MHTMNGPTLRYTLVYTLLPRKVHTLGTDGYYHPIGYRRGHLVRSEGLGGVMYHKVEECMSFKCDCRLNKVG